MLTLVASALAGGDCIDDADALRAQGAIHPRDLPAQLPTDRPLWHCRPLLMAGREVAASVGNIAAVDA